VQGVVDPFDPTEQIAGGGNTERPVVELLEEGGFIEACAFSTQSVFQKSCQLGRNGNGVGFQGFMHGGFSSVKGMVDV